MPKGKVTEDELSKSIKSIGSFSSITGEGRPRRDSPFGATASEQQPEQAQPEKVVEMLLPEGQATQAVVQQTPQPEQTARARVIRERAPESVQEAAQQVRVVEEEVEPTPKPPRKADLYPEKVLVNMNKEMRDAVDDLAKELHRQRTTKDERITGNTVIRVAIRSFLDSFELGEGDVANNEEELLQLVEKKLPL